MDTNHTTMTDDTLDRLAGAHTRTVDALAGFETMAEDAEPEFSDTVARFIDLHQRHADALAAMLAANGREADPDGSFMATVNTLVVKTRALFDEIDEDVMDAIRDGERHVIDAYEEVERGDAPIEVAEKVRGMRDELEMLLREASQV